MTDRYKEWRKDRLEDNLMVFVSQLENWQSWARRRGGWKSTNYHSIVLPVPHITPWHWATSFSTHAYINTQTLPYRSIPAQVHSEKVQQPMTQMGSNRFSHTAFVRNYVVADYRDWRNVCRSQTTMHVIEPVCSYIHPDSRPSCVSRYNQ